VRLEAGEFQRIPEERASLVDLGWAETIAAPPGGLLGGGGDRGGKDQDLHLVLRRLGLESRLLWAKNRWFGLDLGEHGAKVGGPGTKVGAPGTKVGEAGAKADEPGAKVG